MAKTDNPLSPLSRLGARLKGITKTVGLQLQKFDVSPDLESETGPHRVTAMFTLDENFTPEPPKDDQWEEFLESQNQAKQEEAVKEARKGLVDLQEKLQRPGNEGIL